MSGGGSPTDRTTAPTDGKRIRAALHDLWTWGALAPMSTIRVEALAELDALLAERDALQQQGEEFFRYVHDVLIPSLEESRKKAEAERDALQHALRDSGKRHQQMERALLEMMVDGLLGHPEASA